MYNPNQENKWHGFTVLTYINVIINCFWNACNNHLQTPPYTLLQFEGGPNKIHQQTKLAQ